MKPYTFRDACRDLAFPTLAALDVRPEWAGNTMQDSSSGIPPLKVDYSFVETLLAVSEVSTSHFGREFAGPDLLSEAEPLVSTNQGPGFDTLWQDPLWPTSRFNGDIAHMDNIDAGCVNFGQGSLDGIIP